MLFYCPIKMPKRWNHRQSPLDSSPELSPFLEVWTIHCLFNGICPICRISSSSKIFSGQSTPMTVLPFSHGMVGFFEILTTNNPIRHLKTITSFPNSFLSRPVSFRKNSHNVSKKRQVYVKAIQRSFDAPILFRTKIFEWLKALREDRGILGNLSHSSHTSNTNKDYTIWYFACF